MIGGDARTHDHELRFPESLGGVASRVEVDTGGPEAAGLADKAAQRLGVGRGHTRPELKEELGGGDSASGKPHHRDLSPPEPLAIP